MQKLGLVGWRGLVGAVLLERMQTEKDFKFFHTTFFSTSQAGQAAPVLLEGAQEKKLKNAYHYEALLECDFLLVTQGSAYTQAVYSTLRARGWKGYWIDAASFLRLREDSVIVLDPINKAQLLKRQAEGVKTFVGGNCTVSLLLLAVAGLLDEVEWISTMTYQSVSGAGAKFMEELVVQLGELSAASQPFFQQPKEKRTPLFLDQLITEQLRSEKGFSKSQLGYPLAGSLLPWIDSEMQNGQSREEFKAMSEANKILSLPETTPLKIDGTCVRIGAMRCHSQGITLKLKHPLPLEVVEEKIKTAHSWIAFVPNRKVDTLQHLTPAAVNGSLNIAVGRVRKMNLGPEYLNLFTVGDQLLWGAAEPLRRALLLLLGKSHS